MFLKNAGSVDALLRWTGSF